MSRHRPPDDDPQALNGRRALVLLLSTAVLVATLFGWIAQQSGHEPIPNDPGTPVNVTTISPPGPAR